jgi:predicted nucleic acid-binding protein
VPPRELVLDTTVLIYLLQRARGRAVTEQLKRFGRFWLSSVVLAELYAGTRSLEDRRSLDEAIAPVARENRVMTPAHDDWVRAGQLIARRTRLVGRSRPRDHLNDVLILLAAARYGAAVVTSNVRHFEEWAQHATARGIVVDVVPFSPDA